MLLPAAFLLYLVPASLSAVEGTTPQALSLAFTLIAGVWYQGVVVQAVHAIQNEDRDLSIGALFRSVAPVLAPLLWTGIIVVLGIFAGFVAFVIPGFVIATWWSVAAPAVVIERIDAMQALGRSRELVRGNGWRVFGVILVAGLIAVPVRLAFVGVAQSISDTGVAMAVGSLLGLVLAAPVLALAPAVLYLALRRSRGEAPPAAAL